MNPTKGRKSVFINPSFMFLNDSCSSDSKRKIYETWVGFGLFWTGVGLMVAVPWTKERVTYHPWRVSGIMVTAPYRCREGELCFGSRCNGVYETATFCCKNASLRCELFRGNVTAGTFRAKYARHYHAYKSHMCPPEEPVNCTFRNSLRYRPIAPATYYERVAWYYTFGAVMGILLVFCSASNFCLFDGSIDEHATHHYWIDKCIRFFPCCRTDTIPNS